MAVAFTVVVPDDDPHAYTGHEPGELKRLEADATVTLYSERFRDRADFFARIAGADAVISVRSYAAFDAEALDHAPRLKLISVMGTGIDHVDIDACDRRGILVTNTPAIGAVSVAELALGLVIAVARAIPLGDRRLRDGVWKHQVGPELAGKTLGLVGLGAVGRRFAHLGTGLGMRVIGWSPTHDPQRAAAAGVELVGLDDLYQRSDVVSIHLRGSATSTGMIGSRELGLMKPTAILVNTARGAIVDETELARALREHRIAGAGLDVFSAEPLTRANNPFAGLDNVVLSPHIGSTSIEANQRQRALPVDNILAWLGGRPQNVVNPTALERARP